MTTVDEEKRNKIGLNSSIDYLPYLSPILSERWPVLV